MKNDHLLTRRRALRVGAAVLGAAGAAGTARLLTTEDPTRLLAIDDPARKVRSAVAAGDAQARIPFKGSAFRLQPMTGYGPPPRTPARTAVRHEPIQPRVPSCSPTTPAEIGRRAYEHCVGICRIYWIPAITSRCPEGSSPDTCRRAGPAEFPRIRHRALAVCHRSDQRTSTRRANTTTFPA